MANKSALAVELARLAEEATPEVFRALMERFWSCKTCHRERDAHPQPDCKLWIADWGIKDANEVFDRLLAVSLHEAKVEDALGLKKKEVGEQISWLVGVDVAQFKRMTAEQREMKLLERMGSVIDVPTIERPSS